MMRRRGIRPLRLGAPGKQFITLGGFAPDLGQHTVVAGPLARRHFDIVTLEVLHPSAHIQCEVKHPLLVIAFRSQLAYHELS